VRTRAILAASLTVLGALANASCTSTTATLTAPTTGKCQDQISASAAASAFAAGGGRSTIEVNAARECTWSASTDSPWITFEGSTAGQGEATIAYRVASNTTPLARSGAVTLASARVEVTQEGAPCTYTLDRSTATVGAAGGSMATTVSAMSGCPWSSSTDAEWLSVASGHAGNGTAEIRLTVAENAGGARTAHLTVADQVLTVSQDAQAASAPAPVPPSPAPPTPPPAPNPGPQPPPPAPEPVPLATIELDGEVSQVTGSCPDIRFRIDGLLVIASAATDYRKSSCRDVQDGRHAKVRAQVMSDKSIRAERIEVDRRNDDDDD
jgi:hypothetical protein